MFMFTFSAQPAMSALSYRAQTSSPHLFCVPNGTVELEQGLNCFSVCLCTFMIAMCAHAHLTSQFSTGYFIHSVLLSTVE